MKFFIPHSTDREQTLQLYQSIKNRVEAELGRTIDRTKIYSLKYTHDGNEYSATVGEKEERVGEEVIAILESTAYLICTPYRGVVRGGPIMVGKDEVTDVVFFED